MNLKKLTVNIILCTFCTILHSQPDSNIFFNIDSFVKYITEDLKLVSKISCGTEENIDFSGLSELIKNQNTIDEDPKLVVTDSLIVFKPYGEYIPRQPYTQTTIELLEASPLTILLEINTIGSYYDYFECIEKYYFSFIDGEWQQTSY